MVRRTLTVLRHACWNTTHTTTSRLASTIALLRGWRALRKLQAAPTPHLPHHATAAYPTSPPLYLPAPIPLRITSALACLLASFCVYGLPELAGLVATSRSATLLCHVAVAHRLGWALPLTRGFFAGIRPIVTPAAFRKHICFAGTPFSHAAHTARHSSFAPHLPTCLFFTPPLAQHCSRCFCLHALAHHSASPLLAPPAPARARRSRHRRAVCALR